jgi:hypothetical protein
MANPNSLFNVYTVAENSSGVLGTLLEGWVSQRILCPGGALRPLACTLAAF